ncbi:hypothetical protein LZC95_21180 [Pendulispora brunnea]|uniref:Uncharacterized protein n=1 Tax=Pendulispora brunnea TaxID=2905690 RepID=A0ABZ2KSP1_9BACT
MHPHDHAHGETGHHKHRPLTGTNDVHRSRYFYSMLLEAEDMSVEQDFHLGNIRRHNAELHGYGTVCGLRVDDTECNERVILRKGVALDCLGREIRVERDVEIDLHEAAEAALRARQRGEGTHEHPSEDDDDEDCKPDPVDLYISICYHESFERPVQALGGPETCCAPSCEPSRVRHGFRIEVSLEPPDPGPEKITELLEDIDKCEHKKLSEWISDWITDCCWSCRPDPCDKDHHCLGLAHVRVIPGGKVTDIDNRKGRPLVLPTVLIAALAQYAVQHRRAR